MGFTELLLWFFLIIICCQSYKKMSEPERWRATTEYAITILCLTIIYTFGGK
jgi:hypothetical protein